MNQNKSKVDQQKRRQFLRGMAVTLGGSAAFLMTDKALSVAVAYEHDAEHSMGNSLLFSAEQMQVLAAVCATILPRTDTPSAAELDCHGFVDSQLKHVFGESQQKTALSIIDDIEQASMAKHDKSFHKISSQQQNQMLTAIEAEKGFSASQRQSFKSLKSLIVFGYFTTEVGATQALNYQAVPGGFKGSIPYSADSKAWGSIARYR